MDIADSGVSEAAQFRIDLLNALADIQVEIFTLRAALQQSTEITAEQLEDIHRNSSALKGKFLDRYAQSIGRLT